MNHGRCAGKTARRSGSALERGVRRRCAAWPTAAWTKHQALGGHWPHVKRRDRSGCLGRRLRSARTCTRLQAQRRCVGGGLSTDEAPKREGGGRSAQRLDLAVGFERGWLAQARGDRATCGADAWPIESLAEARALYSRPMAASRWSEARGPGWRRLTFELSRPRRQAGLAVRPMMDQGGCAAKPACRSGSALERGVRPRRAADRTHRAHSRRSRPNIAESETSPSTTQRSRK
jgi:hypothetical protein